jgi:chromosome segregation ATPase
MDYRRLKELLQSSDAALTTTAAHLESLKYSLEALDDEEASNRPEKGEIIEDLQGLLSSAEKFTSTCEPLESELMNLTNGEDEETEEDDDEESAESETKQPRFSGKDN